ncbi:hypothetical protein CBL_06988 [Carabus blaptoides fortunei]
MEYTLAAVGLPVSVARLLDATIPLVVVSVRQLQHFFLVRLKYGFVMSFKLKMNNDSFTCDKEKELINIKEYKGEIPLPVPVLDAVFRSRTVSPAIKRQYIPSHVDNATVVSLK